jgi:hypothetical protein
MTTPDHIAIPETVRNLALTLGRDPRDTWHNCHGVSLAIVQSGLWPGARVARGWAKGVSSQHSWAVVGDPYDKDAYIIDGTLWSYDDSVPGVWQGSLRDGIHVPHGAGHFMTGTPPQHYGEQTIHLNTLGLSTKARRFLDTIGAPFDYRGWSEVAHLPVEGWPAGEILSAMDDTPALAALVPIDRLGMLTDKNPAGVYLPTTTNPR